MPLDTIVRGKLEDGRPESRISQAERDIQEVRNEMKVEREALKAEREAAKKDADAARARVEQETLQASQIAQEQAYVKMAVEGEYPELGWLAKEEPHYAIAMGYAAHGKFKIEHGREPTMEELVATVEKGLAKRRTAMDDEDKPKGGKRKGAVSPGGATPAVPANLEDMDPEERVKLAKKELKKMRAAEKTAEAEE